MKTRTEGAVASPHEITFSFGKNWKDFLSGVSEENIELAREDIQAWLGEESVLGKRVIDVGSGSGIHSLCFVLLGAKTVYSFDVDPFSVEATEKLHEQCGSPSNWTVAHGSVLDRDFLGSLGKFDIVYSWGVLHHTGAMWDAIDNVIRLVAPGGKLWISLYQRGPRYPRDLALKKRYNAASEWGKRWLIGRRIFRLMLRRLRQGRNPLAWNEKKARGMDRYHDIVDWLGGLPYETATEDEVVRFMAGRGLVVERIRVAGEGACSTYVFALPVRSDEGNKFRVAGL